MFGGSGVTRDAPEDAGGGEREREAKKDPFGRTGGVAVMKALCGEVEEATCARDAERGEMERVAAGEGIGTGCVAGGEVE